MVSRRDLGFLNSIAGWLAIASQEGRAFSRVEKLFGGQVVIREVASGRCEDLYAATCAARIGGESVEVRGSHGAARHLAQYLLGGPEELPAPRPLGMVEQALWALATAAAAEDLGIACEVMACEAPPLVVDSRDLVATVDLAGIPATVGLRVPSALELRLPPTPIRRWPAAAMLDAPVIVGRCALPKSALGALAVRSLITLEPAGAALPSSATGRIAAELAVFGGSVGICGEPESLVAEVTTGYVPRPMALPDDAHVELTVGLGTTRLSLRQVLELAIGQVVPLGRPLAGPFDIHAAGRRVGRGELVNIDGELGVRIVSLEE